jgi:hypothetical protein
MIRLLLVVIFIVGNFTASATMFKLQFDNKKLAGNDKIQQRIQRVYGLIWRPFRGNVHLVDCHFNKFPPDGHNCIKEDRNLHAQLITYVPATVNY